MSERVSEVAGSTGRRFAGRVAVVTGGAQGIGKAVCQALGREGAAVAIADVDAEAGAETLEELRSEGIEADFFATDVANPEEVRALFVGTHRRFGDVHVLVNNAGIGWTVPLERLEVADFDRVIAVNLRGALLAAKYALPYMKASGGAIVNIVSTRAFMSEPDTESYAASKGGLLALTHALAISLGRYRIRVNAISPGWIDTSGWKKRANRRPARLSEIDHSQHPAGRVGIPEDIARAVLFLADPEAGFITGANLVIDGGMTVKMIYAE